MDFKKLKLSYSEEHIVTEDFELVIPPKAIIALEETGYYLVRTEGLNEATLFQVLGEIGDLWKPSVPTIDVKVNTANTLKGFSNSSVPPHNECCHEEIPPVWISLTCIETALSGGEFFLINTDNILSEIEPEYYQKLEENKFVVRSPKTNFEVERTVFCKHPITGKKNLFYTTVGRKNPTKHGFKQASNTEGFSLAYLNKFLFLHKKQYLFHNWKKGDFLIFDNFKFMHGRTAFEGNNRHLKHIRLISKKNV